MTAKFRVLAEQAVRFFMTSGVGWLIDFTVYAFLSALSGHPFVSNIVSSLCGVTFVFAVSSKKTFVSGRSRLTLRAKFSLYLGYQAVFILLSSAATGWLSGVLFSCAVPLAARYFQLGAKIIVTPFTMVVNFIAMKLLIEKL